MTEAHRSEHATGSRASRVVSSLIHLLLLTTISATAELLLMRLSFFTV